MCVILRGFTQSILKTEAVCRRLGLGLGRHGGWIVVQVLHGCSRLFDYAYDYLTSSLSCILVIYSDLSDS
jgi:hypothetical protein